MTTNAVFGNTTLTKVTAQANYLYFNDYLKRVGGMISVINSTTSSPPGSPALEDAYIVGPSPSGSWAGLEARIVIWFGGSWKVLPDNYEYNVHDANYASPALCYSLDVLFWFYPLLVFSQTISTTQEVLLNTNKYGHFRFEVTAAATLTINVDSPLPGHMYHVIVDNTAGGDITLTLKSGSWLRVSSSYVVPANSKTIIGFTKEGSGPKGVAFSPFEGVTAI